MFLSIIAILFGYAVKYIFGYIFLILKIYTMDRARGADLRVNYLLCPAIFSKSGDTGDR